MGDILITCPKCSEVLDRYALEGVEVDICPGCRGFWLDSGELRLLRDRAAFWGLEQVMAHAAQAPRSVPPSSSRVRLPCPTCQGKLVAVQLSGTWIDVCNQCDGIWLDRGELDAALRAIGPEADDRIIRALLDL